MRKEFIVSILLAAMCLFMENAAAQVVEGRNGLRMEVRADRPDQIYQLGDSAHYSIQIEAPRGQSGEMRLEYRFSFDGATEIEKGFIATRGGRINLAGSLDQPGFLRLDLTLISTADTLQAACGCGFDPYAIRPTNVLPPDFERFWKNGRAELLRVPMEPLIEEVEQKELPGAHRFKVSLAVNDGTRISGWLTVPPGKGPFPAVLYVPYAGVYDPEPRTALARAGLLVLTIEVHGLELGREPEYYRFLADGALDSYRGFGADDPYRFYYRRAVLGAIRALDYLCSRPDVDSSRIGIAGGSQGGALCLLTAGLDNRIKAVAASVPAMCDHTGRFFGRPSGWPNIFQYADRERVARTCGYFDAALNAGFITAPTLIAVGFIDPHCCPTTVFAAYNNLKGPREIDCHPWYAHATPQGWFDRSVEWLARHLGAAGWQQ
jgi:cephalosporin-C deacetylase